MIGWLKRLFALTVVDEARNVEIVMFAIETTARMHVHYPTLTVPYIIYEWRRDGAVASTRAGVPCTVVLDRRFAARKPLVDVLEALEHELAHAYCARIYGALLPDHDHRFRDMLELVRAA